MSHSDHAVEELFISDLSDEQFGIHNEDGRRLAERKHRLSVVTWIAAGFLWGAVVAMIAALLIGAIVAMPAAQPMQRSIRLAPSFTLTNLDGVPVHVDTYTRQLIIVTTVNCQPCRDRVPADRLAAKIAASNGIAVTNLLVAASSSTARTFVTELNPHADNLLIDDGTVGVDQYAGADDGCWIVVEDQRVIWQGPADLNQIAVHLVR